MQNANAWIITGISSGFGNELARRLLAAGKTVVGTVRSTTKIEDLIAQYPDTLDVRVLDVTDVPAVHAVLTGAIKDHGGVDVLISNAGFGLFGAAEELTDEDIDKIIATDLTGSIQIIRTVLPFMRRARHGRIIQISSYDGQVAYAANSLYHAAKFGIEGFCESVAQGAAEFVWVSPSSSRAAPAPGSATAAPTSPTSCPSTITCMVSSTCSTPPRVSPPATPRRWRPA